MGISIGRDQDLRPCAVPTIPTRYKKTVQILNGVVGVQNKKEIE